MAMTQLFPPLADRDDASDEVLRGVLDARARDQAARLRELRQERDRIDADIERVRQHLDHLAPLLRDVGLEPPEEEKPGNAFVPGNRSKRMPARRPEFASLSLPDAVAAILADGRTLHADQLVDIIFEEHSPAQHKAAKGTLASALAAGVNAGRWERAGANLFRLKEAEPAEEI